MDNLYSATFFHPQWSETDKRNYEGKTEIQFTAKGRVEAVRDALRFYAGRQRAIPDYFGLLWALKVYTDHPGPIDEDGQLSTSGGFPFFEWKIDYGDIEYTIASLESLVAALAKPA